MPKLLALLSNPDDEVKLRMDREIKEINSRISPKVSHDFESKLVPAINIDELPGLLIREKPELLHFSGHGSKKELCFEDKLGNGKYVSGEAIEVILKETGRYITCLLLNCCASAQLAQKISNYIPYVIGFPAEIDDIVAETFSKTFYETLSLGHSFASSFTLAKGTIISDVKSSTKLPVLFENKKLPNYGRIVFREPTLQANFELNVNNKPIRQDKMYRFNFNISNLPINTSYIIYEFIDDSISEDERFVVINDLSAGAYCDECDLFGNIIIRAWLWFGEQNYGIGIQSTLEECLRKYYSQGIPANCKKAYQDIMEN